MPLFTVIKPASVSSGLWETIYDVDFTTESVQDFAAGGDGDYTIGGITWSISGTAGMSVCEIVDGVGLRATTNSTSAMNLYIADIYM